MPAYAFYRGSLKLHAAVRLSHIASLYAAHRQLQSATAVESDCENVDPEPGVALRITRSTLTYEVDGPFSIHFAGQFESFLLSLNECAAEGWVSFESSLMGEEPDPVFRGPTALAVAEVKVDYYRAQVSLARAALEAASAELQSARAAAPVAVARLH